MHLLKIKVIEDFRCLKEGLEIELLPLTLLVGEQGCGKSSLLMLLQRNEIETTLSEWVKKNGTVASYFFDSESMNPRINDLDEYTNPNGTSKGIGPMEAVRSHFESHGETLREFTVNKIKEVKDAVLLMDEPESALSPRNQFKLAKEFKKAAKKNAQIIAATHCIPLIESVEKVYSLETFSWISSKEFLEQSKK